MRKTTRGRVVQHIGGRPQRIVTTRQKNRSKLGYKLVEKLMPMIQGRAIIHSPKVTDAKRSPDAAFVNYKATDGWIRHQKADSERLARRSFHNEKFVRADKRPKN